VLLSRITHTIMTADLRVKYIQWNYEHTRIITYTYVFAFNWCYVKKVQCTTTHKKCQST